MSRIFEALRRADLEREAGQEPELNPVAEPPEMVEFLNPSSVLGDVRIDNIAKHAWTPSADAIPCLQERGVVVEQFRGLRTRLAQARHEAPIKTVLISSGMPSEGKSFVALNLAISLARDGTNRVLLIDGDLRCPTLHESLGAPNKLGLSEYLAGTIDWIEITQQFKDQEINGHPVANAISNLTFIPSGASSDKSSELVSNGRMRDLIASLSQYFDWIVIDSPPVLAITDAIELARIADAVLLVAREARTPLEVAQRAQAAFQQSRILGFVLNGAKRIHRKRSYYYSSYYSSYYGATDPSSRRNRPKKERNKG